MSTERLGEGGSRAEGPNPDDDTAPAYPELRRGAGLVVKQSFWTWPEKNISGNAVDFFTQVEGKTFHQAMEIITQANDYDQAETDLRKERGNVAEIAR